MVNKKQILLEGRYDSFTRKIVKDIMVFIKKTEGITADALSFSLPYDKNEDESYQHECGMDVEVDLRIKRVNDVITYGNRETPYYINTYIADDDVLVMEILIDESYDRKFYEQMFYKINEDIRHEIEHYTQNMFPNCKKQPLQNTADYETVFAHHMDPSEVEALVHGFYRRSKLEKRTLDEVMFDDIQKDIQDGNLTPDEGDTLLRVWIKYAVNNLPHAKYSNSFRRQFIIQK